MLTSVLIMLFKLPVQGIYGCVRTVDTSKVRFRLIYYNIIAWRIYIQSYADLLILYNIISTWPPLAAAPRRSYS
jgi:hypothetical protein